MAGLRLLINQMRAKCELCGLSEPGVSAFLGLCPGCARKPEGRDMAKEAHRKSLSSFGLGPPENRGIRCGQCINDCQIPEEKTGTCGLRGNIDGVVGPVVRENAVVDWYYDYIPTNCVAEWVCPANADCAAGKRSLAVFFHGCTFDCLFCQNWHHREGARDLSPQRPMEQLVRAAGGDTYCVCFFGGDPTPQLQSAFRACELILEREKPFPRICWETNGSMSASLAKRVLDFSLRTGGTVKFDLKAYDENLHYALCGASNKQTLQNFRSLGEKTALDKRATLVASTLLVPGYVNPDEIHEIAEFIADVNPETPYSLLAFHPDYVMTDLRTTSRALAQEAFEAAKEAGLKRVRIGNMHLLL